MKILFIQRHLSNFFPIFICLAIIYLSPCNEAEAKLYSFNSSFVNAGAEQTQGFRLWLPDAEPGSTVETAPVRGIVFMLPGAGTDFRGQAARENFQKAASALGFGIIGGSDMVWGYSDGEAASIVQSVLDSAAQISGRPELSNAPFASVGVSNGGYNSTRITSALPDRAIGFVNIRGGYFLDSTTPLDEALKVPGLHITAQNDSIVPPHETYREWALYRQHSALHAHAIEWDTTHYDTREGQSWEAAWYWIGEMTRHRYGDAGYLSPTSGVIPTLNDMDVNDGWLGEALPIYPDSDLENLVPPDNLEIASIASGSFSEVDYLGSWLPSEGAARVYKAFTSYDELSRPYSPKQGPLHFTMNPVSEETDRTAPLFRVGETTTIETEVHFYDLFTYGIELTEVDYYLNDQFLGTVVADNYWSMDVTFTESGIHALTAIGRDADGNEYPAFYSALVQHSFAVPEPASMWLVIFTTVQIFSLRERS